MLEGKAIIITGAGSGIGRVAAEVFAHYGARLLLVDRNAAGLERLSKAIGRGAIPFQADVSDETQVRAMAEEAINRFYKIDGAFNNAGVEALNTPLHEIDFAAWRKVASVNLDGVFLCMKHEIRVMLPGGRGGSIVNMASALGQVAMRNACDYVAAKHGVMGLTRAAALDYADKGIRINAVLPGIVETTIMKRFLTDPNNTGKVEALRRQHPMGRFAQPSEVAEAAAWLLSDRASFVTGTGLSADGGFQAQ